MKSITLHNMEEDLAQEIEKRSQAKGISQNKFIKGVLRSALGLDGEEVRKRRIHYDQIFNSMTAAEAEAFYRTTEDLTKVDRSQW